MLYGFDVKYILILILIQIVYLLAEYGMDRVETIQSSPNPRATDPNPGQSS